MRKLFITAAVLSLLAFPGLAPADTSLGLRGGTLGGGAELSYALSQRAAVRLNADGYTRKQTSTESDIDYDMKLKLKTVSLLGDWFPFANNFRISAGAMFNGIASGANAAQVSISGRMPEGATSSRKRPSHRSHAELTQVGPRQ